MHKILDNVGNMNVCMYMDSTACINYNTYVDCKTLWKFVLWKLSISTID